MGTIVRFVQTKEDEKSKAIMKKAFEETNEGADDGNCVWFTIDQCLQVTQREKKVVFVFDHFEGHAFDHLAKHGNRICGPIVLLECMQKGQQLPKSLKLCYSFAMRDMVISCTGLERAHRDKIHSKVEYMMGEVSRDFSERVTHLVAGEVGSKKYLVAASLGKRIMTSEWVEVLYDVSSDRVVHGDDEEWDQYKCPVLLGQVITVSGLDTEERVEVKQLVEKGGGRYTGEMKINECTHLIINKPRGQKYEFAKKWQIKIVKPQWLYDSMKKGVCCDTVKYKMEGESDNIPKSSTPNRGSTGAPQAGISNIADMSAISVAAVNETAMNQTTNATGYLNSTRLDTTVTSNIVVHPLDELDVTSVKPSDLFLDGCRIYLSGFKTKRLEKVRRIINIGGGTRLSQLTDNVTHLVMDDRCEDDVKTMETESLRPHVVNYHWLIDCMKQNERLSEEPYKCLELTDNQLLPPVNKPRTSVAQRNSTDGRKSVSQANNTTVRQTEPNTGADELNDIMSQYLPGAGDNTDFTAGDGSTLIRAMDEAMGGDQQQQQGTPKGAAGIATPGGTAHKHQSAPQTAPPVDEDETQDPSAEMQEEEEDGGNLFEDKTFVLLGFMEQYTQDLTEIICEVKGRVVVPNKRTIPDYAVVPLLGHEVNMTVGEVVTFAWVQMCIESETILGLQDNEIFLPVDYKPGCSPLEECVLSISGYCGVERDALMMLAEQLGALCQEYFVKKPNKDLKASTHLVVNAPEGSKYNAAKKWKLPAITKQWLFDSARSGKKEDESTYNVDDPEAHKTYSERVKTTSTSVTPLRPESSRNSLNRSNKENEADADVTADVTTDVTTDVTMEMTSEAAEKVQISVESNNRVASTSSTLPFESTPRATNPRIQEIKEQMVKEKTPKIPSGGKDDWNGVDTPGKFLNPDVIFRPKYDLTAFAEAIQTPANEKKQRPATPLSEILSRNMAAAIKNTAAPENRTNPATPLPAAASLIEEEPSGPLKGVIIAVGKKLSKQQSEFNNIAAELGADYRWTYDQSCTHYIFQGRANDTSKEFRTAKSQKKIIVSPHWLEMCKEQNCRVDESLFPHTYNPNMSLSLSTRETPAQRSTRATRSTRSKSSKSDEPASPPPDEPKQKLDFMSEAASPPGRKGRLTRGKRQNSRTASSSTGEEDREGERKTVGAGRNEGKRERTTSSSTTEGDGERRAGRSKGRKDREKKGEGDRRSKGKREGMSEEEDELNTTQSDEEMAQVARHVEEEVKTGETQAYVKDLQKFMAATKTYSKGRKARSRRTDSTDSIDEPDAKRSRTSSIMKEGSDVTVEDVDGSGGSGKRSNRSSLRTSKKTSDSAPEPSQMVEVGWDDPAAREHQEKLASELAKHSDSLSPRARNVSSEDENMTTPRRVSPRLDLIQKRQTKRLSSEEDYKAVPTPEHPSLALPVVAQRKDLPKPVMISVGHSAEKPRSRAKPKFLLSGMQQQERDDYGALVEELGGIMSDAPHYDSSCTHLVVGNPTRNEKYLACVATGKWILHKSYFEACRKEGDFVEEETHEWGSDSMSDILKRLPSAVSRLAKAAQNWRITLYHKRKVDPDCVGAFEGWRVVIITEKKREDGFRRLLEAGGAIVVATKPPFSNVEHLSHAFMDLPKVQIQVDVAQFVNAGVNCLKPEYIAAYLTDHPAPKLDNFFIPEAQALMGSGDNR